MALLETIQLEHLPQCHKVHIALYRDVKNAAFLHDQLLAGNASFEYALIDASVIVSKIHALAAAYRAVNDMLSDRLRSRNVHSEIVFSLSPNNNIAESFRRFGITPSTTSLLLIKITTDPSLSASDIASHLTTSIEGEALPFTDESIENVTDLARVRKIYKLNAGGGAKGKGGKGGKGGVNNVTSRVDERKELEVAVLGAIALRGATN
ncbi:kinase binding protein CGI-121-domain-containing protein [Amylocarpus encephaloides]|uniref:EKC/KEOPS complex subunit CGI121 n=1 Tax=Amylocarpus encephaloides TaxID=45428 RepID=A0A9P7YGN2_9HELO|nr:kinase binding protein CGI-121-domain-containing protein [Amylocarpus encephaloides]